MKTSLLVGVVLLAAIAATATKAILNHLGRDDREESRAVFSRSTQAARSEGVLIAPLTAPPGEVAVGGTRFTVAEAWVERYAVERHPWVWFKERVPAGGFVVVVRPTELSHVALWAPPSGASFVQEGSPGRVVYHKHFEEMPPLPLALTLSLGRERTPLVLHASLAHAAERRRPEAFYDPDVQNLLAVRHFAFGPVGDGGHTSPGEAALGRIVRKREAIRYLLTAFEYGEAHARCYALVGLREASPELFPAALATARKNAPATLSILGGCLITRVEPARLLADIEAGAYAADFQRLEERSR